jgi:hypothetical protein
MRRAICPAAQTRGRFAWVLIFAWIGTSAAAGVAASGGTAGLVATAGGRVVIGGAYYWPGYYGYYPWGYVPYGFYGPCYPAGACDGLILNEITRLERRQRIEALRRPPPEDGSRDLGLWGAEGSPWGYVRRVPPPTDEGQIQPGYRGSGLVRPEYLGIGQPLE